MKEKEYIINEKTNCLLNTNNGLEVIEFKEKIIVNNKLPLDIISESCLYYGCTLQGRIKGTKKLIGSNYKAPIIISEYNNIIAFPTTSPKNPNCSWIIIGNLESYIKINNESVLVKFKNSQEIIIKMKYYIFNKQVLRASRLLSILIIRKNSK